MADDTLQRVEVLIQALEAHPDAAARESARELVRALMDLHAIGLSRVLELAPDAADAIAGDERAGSLLLLHGLHPWPIEKRVQHALDRVRTLLQRKEADVELVAAAGDKVTVRLRGSLCTDDRLRAVVEEAILAADPDVETIEYESIPDPATGRVPLLVRARS